MKKRLNTTKAIVLEVLEKDVQARNSDNHLYLQVLRIISQKHDLPLADYMSLDRFFEWLGKDNCPYPGFETVRRARQKVQAEYPHLAASERVQEFRAENETAFREFARG